MHSDHLETNIFSQMKLWRCIRNTMKFWLQQLLTGGLLLELGAVVRGHQGVDLRWSVVHKRTLQLSRIYMDFSNTCQSFASWALNGRAEKKHAHWCIKNEFSTYSTLLPAPMHLFCLLLLDENDIERSWLHQRHVTNRGLCHHSWRHMSTLPCCAWPKLPWTHWQLYGAVMWSANALHNRWASDVSCVFLV